MNSNALTLNAFDVVCSTFDVGWYPLKLVNILSYNSYYIKGSNYNKHGMHNMLWSFKFNEVSNITKKPAN